MQFSLKKSKEQTSSLPLVPAWHPNFRNYARLPDTKVVRTAFFVNGAAVFLAIAALLFFAYREYTLNALNNQIASWNAQIEADRGPSNEAVALFRQFQTEEKIITEVAAFTLTRLTLSDFLLHLGQTLPTNIAISAFEIRDTGITLRAVVRGAPDRASGQATAFVDQLRKDSKYGALFSDVTPTNVNRDPGTGRLLIELVLKFKPEEGAKP
ncbi:MAG TPA: hypothetical protein VGD88_16210 [Opitutaceae bacterium]